jgi:hypothetical protein
VSTARAASVFGVGLFTVVAAHGGRGDGARPHSTEHDQVTISDLFRTHALIADPPGTPGP